MCCRNSQWLVHMLKSWLQNKFPNRPIRNKFGSKDESRASSIHIPLPQTLGVIWYYCVGARHNHFRCHCQHNCTWVRPHEACWTFTQKGWNTIFRLTLIIHSFLLLSFAFSVYNSVSWLRSFTVFDSLKSSQFCLNHAKSQQSCLKTLNIQSRSRPQSII